MKKRRLTFYEFSEDDKTYWVIFVKVPKMVGFTHKVLVLKAPGLSAPLSTGWLAEGFPPTSDAAEYFLNKHLGGECGHK